MPNGVEDNLELRVVLLFKFIQSPSQVSVGGLEFTQSDKGAHDFDIHRDSPFAAQNAREHRHALFGERAAQCACRRALLKCQTGISRSPIPRL